MKKVVLSLGVISALLASCANPQKQDERAAEEKANDAMQLSQISQEQQNASDANAADATVAAIQSNIDAAMAKVTMPEFKKLNAKMLAEDFHKYLSQLVNANSGKKAADYADKLLGLQDEYNKKVADEKLEANDKTTFDKYVSDMINAVKTAN